MQSADFPSRSDFEPGPDDFLLALEHNALARWWRAHAGARGETGARVIPWDRPPVELDAPTGLDGAVPPETRAEPAPDEPTAGDAA